MTQQDWKKYNQKNLEEIDAAGKGGDIHCYRCGGHGLISKNHDSPEPVKGESKGKGKKRGGQDGRKGKNGKGNRKDKNE